MALTKEQIKRVENTIKESLRNKFQSYKSETNNMPFHYRLLGQDRMALFSFIHSLNTTFGTSIFEPVAETLASLNFPVAQKQFVVGNTISEHAQIEIQRIMNELTIGNGPNKSEEIARIRKVCLLSIKFMHDTFSHPLFLYQSPIRFKTYKNQTISF